MIRLNHVAFFAAISLVFALPEANANPYQDYKCHIVSSKKDDRVVFYRWKVNDFKLKMASMPGQQLSDIKDKKYFIKEVQECVLLSEDFSSEKSQRVDEKTLR
jgi:hypothetical protein